MKTKADLHLIRKLWHVATGLSALFLTYQLSFTWKAAAAVSGAIGLFSLLIEVIRLNNDRFNKLFHSKFKLILREAEKSRPSGLMYYAFGVSLTFVLYDWNVSIISILLLIFADPFASLFGVLFGRHKILKDKSLEGTVACLVISCFIGWIYYSLNSISFNLTQIFIIGLAGAIGELFTIIDDNLSLPVVAGAIISLYLYLV